MKMQLKAVRICLWLARSHEQYDGEHANVMRAQNVGGALIRQVKCVVHGANQEDRMDQRACLLRPFLSQQLSPNVANIRSRSNDLAIAFHVTRSDQY